MSRNIIAIDGPAGVGKSTLARRLARELNWTYLDTGALYRAVAHAWIKAGEASDLLDDERWLAGLDIRFEQGHTLLQGRDVSEEIRRDEINSRVSAVSARSVVRQHMTALQRLIGSKGRMILDGRDIGTVVFPDACLKLFLEASPAVRARRRWEQLGCPPAPSLAEVEASLLARDEQDRGRTLAPLVPAADAWRLSTDEWSEDQVLQAVLTRARTLEAKCRSLP